MTTYRVTFTLDVASDRDPREWDWPALLDVTDDVDTLDESSITITRVEPESCDHIEDGPCPTCDYCGRSQCEDDRYWNGDTGCHVECENVAALAKAEYVRVRDRHDRLVERYNREYRGGRWTTNRTLAGQCEDAYSAMHRALTAWQKLDPSAAPA